MVKCLIIYVLHTRLLMRPHDMWRDEFFFPEFYWKMCYVFSDVRVTNKLHLSNRDIFLCQFVF